MKELDAIKARYRELQRAIRPRRPVFELPTAPEYQGGHHVEFVDGEYRYIMSERGAYLDVQKTRDPDELAYWIAIHMTIPLLAGESNHRKWLDGQARLLGKVDPAWEARRRREIPGILGTDKITAAIHKRKMK
jgi:hypothetical protein